MIQFILIYLLTGTTVFYYYKSLVAPKKTDTADLFLGLVCWPMIICCSIIMWLEGKK